MRWLALPLLCLAAPPAVHAAAPTAAAKDIGVGDPLRRTLLNALRPTLERDLGQKLIFVVHRLRVQEGWAFAEVLPQTPAGRPVDFLKTRHAERQRLGMLDGDGVTFILLRRGKAGWKVLSYAIGPTDVTWDGWDEEFGAPTNLFDPGPG